ncbi:hypothetical protein BJX96DRAFT_163612 [Aspergillus floccosus]
MAVRQAIKPQAHPQPLGCFPLRKQTLSPILSRRHLGTKRDKSHNSPLFACTWVTGTPHAITPDDVLPSLPSPSQSLAESAHVPVLLVTPSFAQWIDTASPFLEDCVNRLARSASPQTVHAIVAIVDRLPDNRAQSCDEDTTESEGLSLMIVRAEDIQGKAAPPRRMRSMETEESALVFSFQGGMSRNDAPQHIHEIGLRLANTIFVNGKENTLMGSRWVYDSSSSRYTLDQSVDLSSCIVSPNTNSVHNKIRLPLSPVSQRRRVISSMGNILRQLAKHTDPTSTAPMPASTELEKELPRYIEENNIEDRRVSVWALVETPGQSAASEATENSLIQRIQAGGKLHRVMSGGGGWGKKQGLLSLDPEIRFLEPTGSRVLLDRLFSPTQDRSEREQLPQSEQHLGMNELSSLDQVAREGDYVQFFVSVDPCEAQSTASASPGTQDVITCQFGVVLDAEAPMSSTTSGGHDLTVVPNTFSALSEKAITYLQPVSASRESTTVESSTKIDIPGARVELVIE